MYEIDKYISQSSLARQVDATILIAWRERRSSEVRGKCYVCREEVEEQVMSPAPVQWSARNVCLFSRGRISLERGKAWTDVNFEAKFVRYKQATRPTLRFSTIEFKKRFALTPAQGSQVS